MKIVSTWGIPLEAAVAPNRDVIELRRRFDAAYDGRILGRGYVETKRYYDLSRERYWRSLLLFLAGEPKDASGRRVLDIGGGQFAVLLKEILDYDVVAADVADDAKEDLAANGIPLKFIDLFAGQTDVEGDFDAICFLEVIEHIPKPPYLVFNQLKGLLRPGGALFLTTPNGMRMRNILRMIVGREVLDLYVHPDSGRPLGHQHEYTRWQMREQAKMAELDPKQCVLFDHGWPGASLPAQLAWKATKAFDLVPHYRSGLGMRLEM